MSNTINKADQYFMNTGKREPIVLVRGEGAKVWDEDGKEYLDFVCGWAVNNLGHCPPNVVRAIKEQAQTLIQTSNHYYTIPQTELAELLIENSAMDELFLCNSGAEANEGAAKLARRYGKIHKNGAYEIISLSGSFHGRTMAMISASGQQKYQEPYSPLPTGYINVEFNNIEAVKAATNEKTCAIILEPVQGEGGINVPSQEYMRALREWCNQNNLLLIFDEVQTGIGRCGALFAYELFAIVPDIITLAKGLGSGLPIGAFMAQKKACVFKQGEHGSTFGGNPLCCAAAIANLKYILNNNIPFHAKEMGEYITNALLTLKDEHSIVDCVRGKGLLLGLVLKEEISEKLCRQAEYNGLLVNNVQKAVIRLMPPLIITKEDANQAVKILDQSLKELGY